MYQLKIPISKTNIDKLNGSSTPLAYLKQIYSTTIDGLKYSDDLTSSIDNLIDIINKLRALKNNMKEKISDCDSSQNLCSLMSDLCLQISLLQLKIIERKKGERLKNKPQNTGLAKELWIGKVERLFKIVSGNALNRIEKNIEAIISSLNNDPLGLNALDKQSLLVICYLHRGQCFWLEGQADKSFNDYVQAEELLFDMDFKITDSWWPDAMHILLNIRKGSLYYHIHNYEKAMHYYDRALEFWKTMQNNSKSKITNCFKIVEIIARKASIEYEVGRFRESLISAFQSLQLLLVLEQKSSKEKIDQFRKMITDININLSQSIKRHPKFINKEDLINILKNSVDDDKTMLKPCEIYKEIKEYKHLGTRIFNQIGFFCLNLDLDSINKKRYNCMSCNASTDSAINSKEECSFIKNSDLVCHWLFFATKIDKDSGVANFDLRLYAEKQGVLDDKDHDFVKNYIGKLGTKIFSSRDVLERKFSAAVLESCLNVPECPEKKLLLELMSSIENLVSTSFEIFGALDKPRIIDDAKNQFIFLRRWSSYTPRLPRPRMTDTKGGGYFLIWHGKGIVIDPGFDFLLNLYNEGLSISDIDAIIVTHPHIDHIDDLYATLMCIYTRKKIREGSKLSDERENDINIGVDLFLNPGTFSTYSRWITALEGGKGDGSVRSITPLPQNITTTLYQRVKRPTKTCKNDKVKYNEAQESYGIQISTKAAKHVRGIIGEEPIGFVLKLLDKPVATEPKLLLGITSDTSRESLKNNISDYAKCNLLVAHVGHVRPIELIYQIQHKIKKRPFRCDDAIWKDPAFKERDGKGNEASRRLMFALGCRMKDISCEKNFFSALDSENLNGITGREHLRYQGVKELFSQFVKDNSEIKKLFVISELGEELRSSRIQISKCLNKNNTGRLEHKTKCLTGDISLRILLEADQMLEVQCTKCAQINDLSFEKTFHKPEEIKEVCIKGDSNAIIYLCKKHDPSSVNIGDSESIIEHVEKFTPI